MERSETRILEALHQVDSSPEPCAEMEVSDLVRAAIRATEADGAQVTKFGRAELYVFSVMPGQANEMPGWGTYYGPTMTTRDEAGNVHQWPDPKDIDAEVCDYWEQRAKEAKHPVLRARYADLVWDLTRAATGRAAPFQMAQMVIDATLDAVRDSKHKHKIEGVERLGRALDVALTLNDQERIASVRDAMLVYENQFAEDTHLGTWGFCFDKLIENPKVSLTWVQREKVISDLEGRLARITGATDRAQLNPHAAEAAAMRLCRHYRHIKDETSLHRVLSAYRDAYLLKAEEADPLAGQAWLQKVYEVLLENGMVEEAGALSAKLRTLGKQAIAGLKELSASVDIPTKEIEEYVSAMTTGPLEDGLRRTAAQFLADPQKVRIQVLELAKIAPIQAIFPRVTLDSDGRPIAQVGSVDDDIEGRIIDQIGQNMHFSALFLREVIDRLEKTKGLCRASSAEHLYKSPVFREDRHVLVEQGLDALFSGDHVAAVHLLIPQIEAALRDVLAHTGGHLYRPGRHGDLRLKTMDEILRDPAVSEGLGERICHHFRVLFTDPRGWNLRNSVMHGFLPGDAFTTRMSDWIFHALLVLAQIREMDSKAGC